MKNPLPAFLFVALITLTGCCVHSGLRHPESRQTLIDELKSDTVALVHRDSDGDISPFCSGVWIDKDKVITADHCARVPVEAFVQQLATGSEGNDELEKMVQDLEDDFKIQYIVDKESTGVWREPKALHVLKVVKHDKEHDLALLQVVDPKDIQNHHVAPLVDKAPPVGAGVHIMGHPMGLIWTYVHGYIGAYREENFRPTKRKGPFIQIVGPVWKGNSGGGAYTEAGELIGLASFMAPAPNECFFIHVESIRSFLNRSVTR